MSTRDTERTAGQRLSDARVQESRDMRQCMHDCDITGPELAKVVGCSKGLVQKWVDKTHDALPNAAHRACFPPCMLEWFARRDADRMGFAVYSRADAATAACLHKLAADITRANGELLGAAWGALEDGRVSTDEGRELNKKSGSALEALLKFANAVRAVH